MQTHDSCKINERAWLRSGRVVSAQCCLYHVFTFNPDTFHPDIFINTKVLYSPIRLRLFS
jgi:hypothetical protein